MLSPAESRPHLCIFGDSHIACLRRAASFGLVPEEVDLEFWGTIGARFRATHLEDGAIVPDDDTTADRFAGINGRGRRRLHPGDFDAILFMGCRTRVDRLFAEFLHRDRTPGAFLSSGVKRAMIRAHLENQRAYGFARAFAAAGQARIWFAPISFDIAGMPETGSGAELLAAFPQAAEGTSRDRDAVWALIGAEMAADGIHLLPQPGRSVTGGFFTDPAYAIRGAAEKADCTHKNAAYGRLMLQGWLRAEAAARSAVAA